MKKVGLVLMVLILSMGGLFAAGQEEQGYVTGDYELTGATQFNAEHPFSQTVEKFVELLNEYQDEVDFNLELSLSGELGIEPDFFNFMSRGETIDVSVIAPTHMAKRVPRINMIEIPFLYRDADHAQTVLKSDIFDSVLEELVDKASVRIIGYAGGSTRNLVTLEPCPDLDAYEDMRLRIQDSSLWVNIFEATGASISVVAWDEVYNALQTGVFDGFETEIMSYNDGSFYEVAPYYTYTRHSVTVRPLVVSEAFYQKFSPTVQDAIDKAGMEAGWFGQSLEQSQAEEIINELEDKGIVETDEFDGVDVLRERATPVLEEFAESLDSLDMFKEIQDME